MRSRGDKKPQNKGYVHKPAGAHPWPHEEATAHKLAEAGYRVEFIPEEGIKMPDIYIGRTIYEIKSPISDKVDAIERNLTDALKKCHNVVFDGARMKLRDNQILRELIKRRKLGKGLKKLLFINKKGEVIDIEKLI